MKTITIDDKYGRVIRMKRPLSPERSRRIALDCFYKLRSDIKFKAHTLTLCDDRINAILKDLKTGKEYRCDIYDTMYRDADTLIKLAKSTVWFTVNVSVTIPSV